MKLSTSLLLLLFGSIILGCGIDKQSEFTDDLEFVTSDVTNFYTAFDAITEETDTARYADILSAEFIDRASIGQARMIEARRYTPEGFISSMTSRPKFWSSLRENASNVESYIADIKNGIKKLHVIYPHLDHSTIYFTVGNHRSPGTGVDSMVLIGCEFALGDTTTIIGELPAYNQDYYGINPIDQLQFLSVHEYVHTQQMPMVHNLLSLTLYEGIAEFIAIKATGRQSPWKAFTYGPKNEQRILEKFELDKFKSGSTFQWLWNSPQNEFKTSDLGYFVGHQIASRYYDAAADKKEAIKNLIELDYNDEAEVEALVNSTGIFSATLDVLYDDYDSRRPTVTRIKQFDNNSQAVDPSINEITVEFSEPLNGYNTGLDYGDLGEAYFPKNDVTKRYWSQDGTSWTMPVELEPNRHYQILISSNFRAADGVNLKPYLIDFRTQ